MVISKSHSVNIDYIVFIGILITSFTTGAEMILAACKDTGGFNNILPLVKLLGEEFEVKILANGRSVELLTNIGEDFERFEDPQEALFKFPRPDLVITSMCSGGGIGRELMPRVICPTVAVQDYWGAYTMTDWHDIRYRPDYVILNDSIGAKMLVKAWPDFNQSHIIQTGCPAYDHYSKTNYEHENMRSRFKVVKIFNLDFNIPIILFTCGVWKGASELLSEIIAALNDSFRDFYFIPRIHPSTKEWAPKEIGLWEKALSEYKKRGLIAYSAPLAGTDLMIRASDLVISDFSTTLVEAILSRKPNISVLYTKGSSEGFNRELGKLVSEPPFVSLGCTAKAKDRTELKELVEKHIYSPLEQRTNQEKHFSLDGQNSQRAVDFIKTLL